MDFVVIPLIFVSILEIPSDSHMFRFFPSSLHGFGRGPQAWAWEVGLPDQVGLWSHPWMSLPFLSYQISSLIIQVQSTKCTEATESSWPACRHSSWKGIYVLSASFPARCSAITLTRTFDSSSGQIRERSSHRGDWKGAGSNGTNVVGACHRHRCWHVSRTPTQTRKRQVRREAGQAQSRWELQSLGSLLIWKG